MKIFFAVLAMLAVLIPAAAWAGQRSSLLSDRELSAIESIAEKAYPQGTKIFMVVDQEFFERFTIIKFIREDHKVSLILLVKPHRAGMISAESPEIGEKIGKKIVESIQKILDESPRLVLGNILD